MEVEVTGRVGVPRDRVAAELDPEAIIEYADNYAVVDTETDGESELLSLRSYTRTGDTLEATYEFTERGDGYVYSQRDDEGPFDEMRTWIELEELDGETEITVRSEFTFGGVIWFVIDRLAVKYRRQELENLVSNLIAEVDPDAETDADADTELETENENDTDANTESVTD